MSIENESTAAEVHPKTGLIVPGQERPAQLYILPIQGRPFLPAQVLPVQIQANPWGKTIERVAHTAHKMVALFRIGDDVSDAIPLKDIVPKTGCAVRILQASSGEGEIQFVAEGLQRVEIINWLTDKPPYLVEVRYMENDQAESETEIKAYAMALIGALKELLPINPLYSEELKHYMNRFSPNDPSPLADLAAAITTASAEELQEVLDTSLLIPRMKKSLAILKKEIEVAKLQTQIREEVNKTISERQREFFLHEQLKVIQKELGLEKDDKTAEVEGFNARMKDKKIPAAVQSRFDEELKKLQILETGSPEYAVTRNYLDWISQVPWGVEKEQRIDLKKARKILDQDHDGLTDVKDRIIEFLAVGAYKNAISGAIMLLVGPPGVGKTSIGHSIASSLDRPFFRFSVGGMRDEAEIKGHRRTYIGAMPGKIVQALKECQVMNPVIMLDEIDKIGISHQGDPASALLETLDPEQNINFLDHYLDLRLDLSKCLFICTANTLDSIPTPLLDRMDTIRLSGYLAEEKLAIARHHLWPRQLEHAGVPNGKLKITDAAIKGIINGYAREAGVRNLEKQLAKIVRKSVVELLNEDAKEINVKASGLEHYLGSPLFRKEKNLSGVGIITGLAWTSLGGATLPIEASVVHQQGRSFKLTGQLGDVMKESATLALEYIKSHAEELGIQPSAVEEHNVHIHVPAGAVPKDGPSAGITMVTSLASSLTGRKVKKALAMTGEITLRGKVLPVGGIREKILAAKRAGIKEIILCRENKKDIDEIKKEYVKGIKFHFVDHIREVLDIALI
jgi:ATP-dependent Lon protease